MSSRELLEGADLEELPLLEGALVLLSLAIVGSVLGTAARAGWWRLFALGILVLSGLLVGLKSVDRELGGTSEV